MQSVMNNAGAVEQDSNSPLLFFGGDRAFGRVWLPDAALPAGEKLLAALQGDEKANLAHLQRKYPGVALKINGVASHDVPPDNRLHVSMLCTDRATLDQITVDVRDLAETATDLVADSLGLTEEELQTAFEGIRVKKYVFSAVRCDDDDDEDDEDAPAQGNAGAQLSGGSCSAAASTPGVAGDEQSGSADGDAGVAGDEQAASVDGDAGDQLGAGSSPAAVSQPGVAGVAGDPQTDRREDNGESPKDASVEEEEAEKEGARKEALGIEVKSSSIPESKPVTEVCSKPVEEVNESSVTASVTPELPLESGSVALSQEAVEKRSKAASAAMKKLSKSAFMRLCSVEAEAPNSLQETVAEMLATGKSPDWIVGTLKARGFPLEQALSALKALAVARLKASPVKADFGTVADSDDEVVAAATPRPQGPVDLHCEAQVSQATSPGKDPQATSPRKAPQDIDKFLEGVTDWVSKRKAEEAKSAASGADVASSPASGPAQRPRATPQEIVRVLNERGCAPEKIVGVLKERGFTPAEVLAALKSLGFGTPVQRPVGTREEESDRAWDPLRRTPMLTSMMDDVPHFSPPNTVHMASKFAPAPKKAADGLKTLPPKEAEQSQLIQQIPSVNVAESQPGDPDGSKPLTEERIRSVTSAKSAPGKPPPPLPPPALPLSQDLPFKAPPAKPPSDIAKQASAPKPESGKSAATFAPTTYSIAHHSLPSTPAASPDDAADNQFPQQNVDLQVTRPLQDQLHAAFVERDALRASLEDLQKAQQAEEDLADLGEFGGGAEDDSASLELDTVVAPPSYTDSDYASAPGRKLSTAEIAKEAERQLQHELDMRATAGMSAAAPVPIAMVQAASPSWADLQALLWMQSQAAISQLAIQCSMGNATAAIPGTEFGVAPALAPAPASAPTVPLAAAVSKAAAHVQIQKQHQINMTLKTAVKKEADSEFNQVFARTWQGAEVKSESTDFDKAFRSAWEKTLEAPPPPKGPTIQRPASALDSAAEVPMQKPEPLARGHPNLLRTEDHRSEPVVTQPVAREIMAYQKQEKQLQREAESRREHVAGRAPHGPLLTQVKQEQALQSHQSPAKPSDDDREHRKLAMKQRIQIMQHTAKQHIEHKYKSDTAAAEFIQVLDDVNWHTLRSTWVPPTAPRNASAMWTCGADGGPRHLRVFMDNLEFKSIELRHPCMVLGSKLTSAHVADLTHESVQSQHAALLWGASGHFSLQPIRGRVRVSAVFAHPAIVKTLKKECRLPTADQDDKVLDLPVSSGRQTLYSHRSCFQLADSRLIFFVDLFDASPSFQSGKAKDTSRNKSPQNFMGLREEVERRRLQRSSSSSRRRPAARRRSKSKQRANEKRHRRVKVEERSPSAGAKHRGIRGARDADRCKAQRSRSREQRKARDRSSSRRASRRSMSRRRNDKRSCSKSTSRERKAKNRRVAAEKAQEMMKKRVKAERRSRTPPQIHRTQNLSQEHSSKVDVGTKEVPKRDMQDRVADLLSDLKSRQAATGVDDKQHTSRVKDSVQRLITKVKKESDSDPEHASGKEPIHKEDSGNRKSHHKKNDKKQKKGCKVSPVRSKLEKDEKNNTSDIDSGESRRREHKKKR